MDFAPFPTPGMFLPQISHTGPYLHSTFCLDVTSSRRPPHHCILLCPFSYFNILLHREHLPICRELLLCPGTKTSNGAQSIKVPSLMRLDQRLTGAHSPCFPGPQRWSRWETRRGYPVQVREDRDTPPALHSDSLGQKQAPAGGFRNSPRKLLQFRRGFGDKHGDGPFVPETDVFTDRCAE